MRLLASFGVLAGMLTLACTGVREPTAPLGPAESPDYAVYDAVLDSLFGEGDAGGAQRHYVIGDSTALGPWSERELASAFVRKEFGPLLAPLLAETHADYVARSRVRVPLDAQAFHSRWRVELVSARTLATLDQRPARNPDTYWRAFYARFPGSSGHITFSRPGYDAAGTHALLFYGHGCGGRCGDWGYVLLERREGKWIVLRRVITAMS